MDLMSQKEEFQISYDGPALQTHEMDVRDLAPALLAVGDALEEANRILNGDTTKVQVNVKGTFKTGSFLVHFGLNQEVSEQLIGLFTSPTGMTATAILGILGFNFTNGFGLIPLIKWLKNRKIKKIITKEDKDGKITIQVADEEIKVDKRVIDLYQNMKIRKSLEVIINKPLQKDGVEKFEIKHNSKTVAVVEKNEKDYFQVSDIPDEMLEEKEEETNLQAVGISFLEDNKWRFTDGTITFYAEVTDSEFTKRVQENKEAFAKDDILRVRLHKKQYVTDLGIKTEYVITKILSHRSSAKQIPLPFETVEGNKTK